MRITEGVHLHFIPTNKYKTQRIKVRFAAPLKRENMASRLMAANMMETANSAYPTSQILREYLANLYGVSFSTSVSRRGLTHFVDINLTFVADRYLMQHENLMDEMLTLLYITLFRPLDEGDGFEKKTFAVEKQNLLNYLATEVEDNFYHASLATNELFYNDVNIKTPKLTTTKLVEEVTPQSALTALTEMINLDRIDIFVVGDFDQDAIRQRIHDFHFSGRKVELALEYQQDLTNIVKEKVEKKLGASQSILELAYHLPVVYNDVNYPALVVMNGLLGGFPHSKLFMNVREKASLAYSIDAYFDIYTGLLKVTAGIDRANRSKTFKLINQQWSDIKRGKLTAEELAQTKLMLKNSAKMSQDHQQSLINQTYHRICFGTRSLSLEAWLAAIDQVTLEEVMAVARLIHLQAVYFLEGQA